MAAKKTEELAAPASNALAVPLTEHRLAKKDDNGRSFIDIPIDLKPEGGEFNTDVRLKIARMKLVQSNSKEMQKESRIDGAFPGVYYNEGTNETCETFTAIPLYLFNERYYNVPKMSNNMVCTSRDGRGEYGVCLKGDYQQHGIPTTFVKQGDGPELEVGVCARCPHAQRGIGDQAACQHAKILVMVPLAFVQQWQDILPRLAGDDDGELVSDIINELFSFGFRSTNLKAFGVIADQGARDMSYFKWAWEFSSFTDSNERGTWSRVQVQKKVKLSPEELVFARSLYKLAQKIRPVVTDVEEMDDNTPANNGGVETPVDL